MTALTYPLIDPVIIEIGPLAVRWYGVMYLIGFILGYFVIRSELRRKRGPIPVESTDEFLFVLILGLLAGGRIGYVLFYNLPVYWAAPWEIVAIWHGGMSFHGGLLGMILAGWIFARRRHVSLLELADIGALCSPPGLFFGRIGNFINGELFGRPTLLPWGIVFPMGGDVPRHPSQLYEAFLEGAVLFALLWWLRVRLHRPGALLAAFLMGYGLARFLIEFVREPDPQIGYLFFGLTMGQLLCLSMIVGGACLMIAVQLWPNDTAAAAPGSSGPLSD